MKAIKKEKIPDVLGGIEERYVSEAAAYAEEREREAPSAVRTAPARRKSPKLGRALAAACLALLLIGSAAFAVAAESGEYRAAVTFFEENGLSAEGLSRAEVKAVYRDITAQRFTYEKTAEVLRRTVPGWEIRQDAPAPEELSSLWERNVEKTGLPGAGIRYERSYRYEPDAGTGLTVLQSSTLACFSDEGPLWTATFPGLYLDGSARLANATAAWGWEEVPAEGVSRAWLARVGEDGTVLWQRRPDHGFSREYIAAVLESGDGTWAVVSRGDLKFLCLSSYDADGNELGFRKTEVGNLGIRNAARLGDGYLIQLWNETTGDTALLCKMDRDGALTDRFSYETDTCYYYIADMTEYEGRVYLSAYAVPKEEDEGGRHEIAKVLDRLFAEEGEMRDITDEELTPLVRENYTAILLLCDPEGGEPQTFYSVAGSLGGRLTVTGAGELEWDVNAVASAHFSPQTSMYSIDCTCKVYRYAFGADGALVRQTDTGETVSHAR